MATTKKQTPPLPLIPLAVVALAVLVGVVVFLQFYHTHTITNSLSSIEAELASTTRAFEAFRASTSEELLLSEERELTLSDQLYATQQNASELEESLAGFDATVGVLSGTVETLEKLTTTDEELLQKYSSVYFLNEHYIPTDLRVIDEKYDLINGKQVSVHAQMWPFLEALLEAAHEDDIELLVLSGYRSFEEQGTLKDMYTATYGVGANKFSADQGFSEHQLGTAVDLTTEDVGEFIRQFEDTAAYEWLTTRAYKYGFVLSYPDDNEYYMAEPWHWRFVGVALATELHVRDQQFYDLEQREIDTYIPQLFE
jgi:LAS superfamily LD-carboxypeptidase LdcB